MGGLKKEYKQKRDKNYEKQEAEDDFFGVSEMHKYFLSITLLKACPFYVCITVTVSKGFTGPHYRTLPLSLNPSMVISPSSRGKEP